ncbi:MAG: hypothetical protein H6R10_1535 [Rhodocyclaceae bacterium]|nr:hypothetical protein [Rhodocyclaceae bacterium]
MKHFLNILGALALGAGAMYYFDPEQGRRRRALAGDRVDSLSHDARDYLDGRRKHAADRVRGLFARVRGRLSALPPGDQQLHGHVRSRLGRVVSHPHAIETEVQEGRVLLKGHILESEYNDLMVELWSLRGVKAIDSQLALHAEPGDVPGLQGQPHRHNARTRHLAQDAAAALAVAGGLGLAAKALRAEGSAFGLLSLAGVLLAYGMGDGARRLSYRRRLHQGRAPEHEAMPEAEAQPGAENMEEAIPAILTPPPAWH